MTPATVRTQSAASASPKSPDTAKTTAATTCNAARPARSLAGWCAVNVVGEMRSNAVVKPNASSAPTIAMSENHNTSLV